MKAEFFSPNEDVILQNEAPTEFYIVVNGSLVISNLPNYFFITQSYVWFSSNYMV